MDKMQAVLDRLDQWGIRYQLVEHHAAYTMADIESFELEDRGLSAKNLFLRNQKGNRHFLLVVAGDKRVDLKSLGAAIGEKLSFASEERLKKHLDLDKGAVSPMGIMFDETRQVEVLMDKDLKGVPSIGFHPAVNTATVYISGEGLELFIEKSGNPYREIVLI